MRKKLFVAVIAVIVSALAFPAAGRDLKILYWNIQNGMWSDQGNNYDNFVDFVKSEDPDICVWCEASPVTSRIPVTGSRTVRMPISLGTGIFLRNATDTTMCLSAARETLSRR